MKFGWQANLIQRVPLSILPQEVVMSLPHNHVALTNLFISSYRGATVFKFGQQNQLLDGSPYDTSPLGIVMPLPFDYMTLINLLYLQMLKPSSTSSFQYFVIIKVSKFCKKDKCCHGS